MQDSKGPRRIDDFADSHLPIVGHGSRNRSNSSSDFFEKDPFNDPFFTQPFGDSMGEFFEPFPFRQSTRPFNNRLHEQQGSRGVVIEELPEDQKDGKAAKFQSHHEPIIEHPDDIALQRDNPVHNRDRSKSHTQSFTFSSLTYGGTHGTYYKASAMRRTGADGLFEEIHEEKDSIKGSETNHIVHGHGNKGHAVTRKKSASGKEDYVETLHNLSEEEKKDFDETWKKLAKKYLPGFGKGLGMLLKSSDTEQEDVETVASSSSAKPAKQLPWMWPWAKRA